MIINSAVNFLSIVLLMIFGMAFGVPFIMGCVVVSQLCMTWCDATSDALIAQASRVDLKDGSTNLNSITYFSFAIGGIVACIGAGFIDMNEDGVEPNYFFGAYALLMLIICITSFFLNRDLEPELILQQRLKEQNREIKALRAMMNSPDIESILDQKSEDES